MFFLVFFEPTDQTIAGKPFELPKELYQQIKFISPNLYELRQIALTLGISSSNTEKVENVKTEADKQMILQEIYELVQHIQPHVTNIITTIGSLGVTIQRKGNVDEQLLKFTGNGNFTRYYPAPRVDNIVNVSGAGDGWTSGFIAAFLRNCKEDVCVNVGFTASERGELF